MTYLAEVLADSPLMYWRFNSGGTDDSGNSRNSTGGTAGSSVAGLLPSTSDLAVQFNGSSQYFQLNYGSWMNTSSISLEVWVKTTTTSLSILASRDNVGRAWQLTVTTAGKVQFVRIFNSAGSTSVATATSVASVNDGNAHHVVATYDGSTCLIYIDGALDSTTGISGGLYASGTSDLHVARYHTASNYYAGTEDELAWYGTVLSSGRILDHYNAGITVPIAGDAASVTATALSGTPLTAISVAGEVAQVAATALDGVPTGPIIINGEVANASVTALDGAALVAIRVIGDVASLSAQANDGSLPVGPIPGSVAVVNLTALDGGVALDVGTDTSNLFNGRRRGGYATVELEVPVVPPIATPPTRVDKAVPLPLPTLVKGRPT